MNTNLKLIEFNTRVWIKKFGDSFKNIPDSYWDWYSENKFDLVWLMGIWKTCDSVIEKCCFEEGLKKDYSRALKHWKNENIIGSPFAICEYNMNSVFGIKSDLLIIKSKLNSKGIKLILDFVPNHFGADSSLIKSHPEIFLSVPKVIWEKDNHTYYKPNEEQELYFAHGRDPFFPAWQDTIQVNFFNQHARKYLTDTMINLTQVCDGIRCDMAMLGLNNVFKNTWVGVLSKQGIELPSSEFWADAIQEVKKVRPDFVFIAEAYWDLEWELQQLGFDFTYDKRLLDRMVLSKADAIREHLYATPEFQKKSIRFIENHDEERAVTSLGKEKSKAAAVIISTIQGIRFYHDGQFEGRKIKIPVQLGIEPEEIPNNELKEFYSKLLKITNADVFVDGDWKLLNPISSWEGNITFRNILAWEWNWKNERRVIVINYSVTVATCRIKLDMSGYPEEVVLVDLLNNQSYNRSAEEIHHTGLYVELKPWQSHIFTL